MISNPFDIGPKLVSAERAVSPIRAGSRIYTGTGCAAPHGLLGALETMEPRPADLEFVNFLTTSALPQVGDVSRTHYHHRAFFVGSEMRGLAASGQKAVPQMHQSRTELVSLERRHCCRQDRRRYLQDPDDW